MFLFLVGLFSYLPSIYEHVVVEHHQISTVHTVPQAQHSTVKPHKRRSKYVPINEEIEIFLRYENRQT